MTYYINYVLSLLMNIFLYIGNTLISVTGSGLKETIARRALRFSILPRLFLVFLVAARLAPS